MFFLIFFLERAVGAVQVRILRYDNLVDVWLSGASDNQMENIPSSLVICRCRAISTTATTLAISIASLTKDQRNLGPCTRTN